MARAVFGWQHLLLCCFVVASVDCAGPLYFIHAPSVLRIGIKETIAVVVQNVNAKIPVTARLESVGSGKKVLATEKGVAATGSPALLNIMVDFDQIPFSSTAGKQHVMLSVTADHAGVKFNERRKLLVSRLSRETFIQTDKPIYTPGQIVRIRIIPVDIHLMPSASTAGLLEIKNANGDIVERWTRLVSRKAYTAKTLELGDNPVLGNWTVSYIQEGQNTSIQFEVREYTLPRFSVKIVGPPYILKSDNSIPITVSSKYVYGRPVSGLVTMTLSIINDRGESVPIDTFRDLLQNGEAKWNIPMYYLKRLPAGIWFPDGDRLLIDATVTEKATGHSENTVDTSIYFSSTPFTITFKESMIHFKPGLPFEVKVNARYPNKKPAPFAQLSIKGSVKNNKGDVTVLLPYSGTTLEAVTDADGNAKVIFGVLRDSVVLDIETKPHDSFGLSKDVGKTFSYSVTPYQSPTNSYILVRTPRTLPQVDAFAQMEVFTLTTKPVKELHYMVVSKGRIVFAKAILNPGPILTLRFKVSASMVPSSNMIVYYAIETNGKVEVVSDFVPFNVAHQFDNKVTIESNKEVKPGAKLNLTIKGSPNSEAAILAVDKSVYLLRDMHRLSQKKVMKRLAAHDLRCSFGGGRDANGVFKDAGLITVSNAGVTADPRQDLKCDNKKSRKRRSAADHECCRRGTVARTSPISCSRQADDMMLSGDCKTAFMSCCKFAGRSASVEEEEEDDIEEEGRQVQLRSNFPETWLFGDVAIGASGIGTLSVIVPDTITTWVLQAFGISPVTGMGVAPSVDVVAFQPFFVQLNLPYSVNRGEQLMLSATLFNYKTQNEYANVYMKGNSGVCYENKEGERSSRRRVLVKANDAYTIYFPLIPLDLGPNNVTVIAYTRDMVDAVRRPLNVEPEGIENIATKSEMIDPSAEIGKVTHVLTIPLKAVPDVIPGSHSATAFITGDLLAPLVTKLLKNVNKALINPVDVYQVSRTETYTVSVPVKYTFTRTENFQQSFRSFSPSCTCNSRNGGCMRSRSATRVAQATGTRQVQQTRTRTVWRQADRFVVRSIAPNVYVLRYLTRTRQLTQAIETQAKAFITESYRRLLGHKTPDGSFSLWGNQVGTLWLTSFVVQNLEDASEFVAIDRKLKCEAVGFLLKSQQANGAFLEKGKSYSKGMMGGNNGDPSMSAFVIISLLTATCPADTVKISVAVESARKYLETKLPSTDRAYDIAIVSYALLLSNSAAANQAMAKLERLAVDNKDKKTRYWKGESDSVSVETTAYALLALLRSRRVTYAKTVARYLMSHRNADGGFSAGQDTVVGLKALAEYSQVQPALDLSITLESSGDPAFMHRTRLYKSNALVQEAIQIPPVGDLIVKSSGVGTAEIQIESHYNTPKLLSDKCHFEITTAVNDESFLSKNNEFMINLQACIRYTGSGVVGLSSVEVGILSGFLPVVRAFELLKNKSVIQRYEYSDRTIILYLDEISSSVSTCLPMLFLRSFDVGLVQPSHIVVKDLLAPEIQCSSFYSPSGSSPMLKKICKGNQCKCMSERCTSCRPTRMRYNFCKKDFAARVKILNPPRDVSTWKEYSVNVQHVYRGSHMIFAKSKTEVLVSGSCTCPRFIRNGVYLIMGQMTDGKVQVNENMFIRQFPDRRRSKIEFDTMDQQLKNLQGKGC